MEREFLQRFTLLDHFARQPEFKEMDYARQQQSLERAMELGLFEYFFVVDAKGVGRYFAEGVVRDHRQEQFFRDVMSSQHFVTEPFIVEKPVATPIATLSSRIYSADGELVGALCGVIKLETVYREIFKENTGDIILSVVSNGGKYIISKDMSLVKEGANILQRFANSESALLLLENGLAGEECISGIFFSGGEEYCGSICPVKESQWRLCLATRKQNIMGGLDKLFVVATIVAMMLLVFAILTKHIKKKALENVQRSFLDKLTGLGNAARCSRVMDIFEKMHAENIMLVCFDLNKFKEINDTLGHQVGDEALVDFAECLRNSFGKNGFVGRMGGDEFMALLAGDVQQLYEESLSLLQREIMAKNSRSDRKYELSVSYGSSVRASHSAEDCPGISVRQLYSQADENMYIFKRSLAKGEKLR